MIKMGPSKETTSHALNCALHFLVLAKGWFSTIACFFPLYAWYLVVEAVMIKAGLV